MLKLFSLETEALTIHESDYDAKVVMNAAEFAKMCHELYQVSENVTIEAAESKVKLGIEGDVGKAVTLLEARGSTSIEVKKEVKQTFSLRYLTLFNKAAACAENVELRLSSQTPLIISFNVPNIAELRYFLAPKMADVASKAE